MKNIKQILLTLAAVGSLFFSLPSHAQPAKEADTAYAQGEVKRIDIASAKITIKHGFIQSLDMPPMTMVFNVKDKTLLNDIAVGDQVRFKAISEGTKILIIDLSK